MRTVVGLAIALILLAPGAMRAETVGVRSGDHEGFTRILVQFAGQEKWVFGRVDGGFEFRPDRADIGYRLDGIYDRIDRARITDVRDIGAGRLFLAVDCTCHGTVFELEDGQVVLDIVSGPAREPGTGVDAVLPVFVRDTETLPDLAPDGPLLAKLEPKAAQASVVVSDRAGLPLTLPRLGAPLVLPDRGREAEPERVPPMPDVPDRAIPTEEVVLPEVAAQPQSAPAEVPLDPDRAARIAQTETVLLEQIARAAAQGLLDADMSEVEQGIAGAKPEVESEPPPPVVEPPVQPATPRGHVSVETGVDRALSARDATTGETDEGEACIDPEFFDISGWGSDIQNGTDIGAYRSSLVGEFDIASGDGVTALARNYVYIGFGAEAKALIHRYPGSIERPDLLYAMAEIMDLGQSSTAEELVDQMACDGATALWATLAQPALRPGQSINRNAVALGFGTLPVHLRRHLGPGLADDFLAAGDRETADKIRAAIDRAGDTRSSEYGLLTAQFDLEDGNVDRATETLDHVVSAGDATLPEALLHRVEATLSSGGAVPEDIVVLLDGLVVQFRGTDTARQMADAGIRARASGADFTAAFAQLDAAFGSGLIAPDRAGQLREDLFHGLTGNTDDVEFLRLSLPRLGEVSRLDGSVRQALASRLLDLGFAGPARTALGDGAAMPQPEERMLLARAALLEDRPAAAIGYLAGLADETSLRLRAEALDMARDHPGALRAHADIAEHEEMLRAAWQGGLWSEVARLDQGPMGSAALLMTAGPSVQTDDGASPAATQDGEPPGADGIAGTLAPTTEGAGPPRADETPLAAAQALIEQSQATRMTLNALLTTVPAPAAIAEARSHPGTDPVN